MNVDREYDTFTYSEGSLASIPSVHKPVKMALYGELDTNFSEPSTLVGVLLFCAQCELVSFLYWSVRHVLDQHKHWKKCCGLCAYSGFNRVLCVCVFVVRASHGLWRRVSCLFPISDCCVLLMCSVCSGSGNPSEAISIRRSSMWWRCAVLSFYNNETHDEIRLRYQISGPILSFLFVFFAICWPRLPR